MKKISVYLRNSLINPSNYYRITQIFREINLKYKENNLCPDSLYYSSLNSKSRLKRYIVKASLALIINFKLTKSLLYDLKNGTDIIVVQRELEPRYFSFLNYKLLRKCIGSRKIKLIWDFDDDIFENGEISKRESKVLSASSKIIVVTSNYLIRKLPVESQK